MQGLSLPLAFSALSLSDRADETKRIISAEMSYQTGKLSALS